MFKSFWQGKKQRQQKEQKTTQQTMGSPKIQFYLNQSIDDSQKIALKFPEKEDEYRSPHTHDHGGFVCYNAAQLDKLRSVGKQMIKLIGKKILSGQLNLTKISFPIRACGPKTALQNSIDSCIIFPYYMNAAASSQDPLQRFKLVTTAILASPFYINMFLKPLNPIIGQTLQAELKDGTKIYCEQISHHPPVSYFLIYGPNESYQFSGYYNFEVSPGLNSLNLKNVGSRRFIFPDGTQITATYPSAEYSNTFIGVTREEEKGQCVIRDEKNNLCITVEYGKLKKKPSDRFETQIYAEEKPLVSVRGSYCGYLDIGSIRYWDVRDFQPYELIWCEKPLDSDWSHRPDILCLRDQNIEQGQKQKQALQQFQRRDTKLRKKYGPK